MNIFLQKNIIKYYYLWQKGEWTLSLIDCHCFNYEKKKLKLKSFEDELQWAPVCKLYHSKSIQFNFIHNGINKVWAALTSQKEKHNVTIHYNLKCLPTLKKIENQYNLKFSAIPKILKNIKKTTLNITELISSRTLHS